jgi:hypothetical protein
MGSLLVLVLCNLSLCFVFQGFSLTAGARQTRPMFS